MQASSIYGNKHSELRIMTTDRSGLCGSEPQWNAWSQTALAAADPQWYARRDPDHSGMGDLPAMACAIPDRGPGPQWTVCGPRWARVVSVPQQNVSSRTRLGVRADSGSALGAELCVIPVFLRITPPLE